MLSSLALFLLAQDFLAPRLHSAEVDALGDVGSVAHAADFDGDGVCDLLAFGSTAGVPELRVRPGLGAGEFGAAVVSAAAGLEAWVEFGDDRSAVADFDGDGVLDVIATAQAGGAGVVALLVGAGDGSFTEAGNYPAPSIFSDTRIAAMEVDEDPGSEIAVAREEGGLFASVVEVVDWDGAAFTVAGTTAPFLSVFRDGLEVGDFDGDGDLDLALDGDEPYLVLQTGKALVVPTVVPDGLDVGGRQLVAADVDGDSDLDLVQVGPLQVVVGLNDGLGGIAWGPPEGLADEPLGAPEFGSVVRMVAHDDDGDGRDELWGKLRARDAAGLVPQGGQVLVRLAFDAGGALGDVRYLPDGSVEEPAGIADLDGDGELDVVGARAWFAGGQGPPPELEALAGGTAPPARASVFDADLDGDADVLGAPSGEFGVDPGLWRNDAAGRLEPGSPFVGGPAAAGALPALGPEERALGSLSGDFDLDGRPELWLAVESQPDPLLPAVDLGWRRFEAQPGGAFVPAGAPIDQSLAAPGVQPAGSLLDVDGDGLPDLVTSDGSFLLGDGVDALAPAQKLSGGGRILDAGDVDGDALQDLLVEGVGVELFLNDGAGGYVIQSLGAASVRAAGLFDLDGDGDLDAALAVDGSPGVELELFENAGGALSAVPWTAPGLAPGELELRVADVDGDGEPDLLISSASAVGSGGAGPGVSDELLPGRLYVLRGRAGGFEFEPLERYVAWPRPALGDFDADGDLDAFGLGLTRGRRFEGPETGRFEQYGAGVAGSGELTPLFGGLGPAAAGATTAGVRVVGVPGGTDGWVAVGRERDLIVDVPFAGLTAYIGDLERIVAVPFSGSMDTPGAGAFEFVIPDLTPYLGLTRTYQAFAIDGGSVNGLVTSSNALEIRFGAAPAP